jgi:AraC family transcriptional regulator
MRASGGLPAWRLKRAMELLEDSQADALTLDEVARPLRLHPSSFCRAFKKSTGLTPHRYLLLCRVNRAKQMMRDSDRTLTEIALDCGFNSSSQFSVVFKRIEGLSPRSFRRSMACTRDAALPQRQLAAEQMHQVLSIPQTQICAPSNGEPRRLTNV